MNLGARQTHPGSKVPMLPSVETRPFDTLRHATGVLMTSSAVKLPLLHDKHLSATDSLLAAATAASRSTGSLLNPWSTSRFQMSRSESDKLLPRRRKACNRLLQRLSLSTLDMEDGTKSSTSLGTAGRIGMNPPRKKERFRRDPLRNTQHSSRSPRRHIRFA